MTLSLKTEAEIEALRDLLHDSCPPWSSTDEGDTKTNRGYEAGGLKDRDIQPMDWEAIAIINALAMNTLQLMANKREDLARKALLEIKGRIDQLIQKHEDQDGQR